MPNRIALVVSFTLCLLALAFVTAAQESTPVPLPDVDIYPYEALPNRLTDDGYPQLGSLDAPVEIREYCGFDSAACAEFHNDAFATILERVARNEVLYTFIPLVGTGDIANGRGAARAALCAAEQGQFWTLKYLSVDWVTLYNTEALDSNRLLDGIDSLDMDRGAWDACMSSDRPDTTLDNADLDRQRRIEFTSAPFILVNGVAALPDAESITASIDLELLATTPDPEATEPPLVVTIDPLMGEAINPPITIALPAGWQYGYDTLLLDDVDVLLRSVPLAVYTGPVTGGQGTIVLLWGFPNLMAGNPFMTGGAEPDLWADGLRLLRLAIIEQGCNIGTDLRTEYTIGGLPAAGTQFSAVDCPELPDTRGWFAGLQSDGINFVFFAFTDPIDAMNSAQDELQSILDTVEFHVEDSIITPEATAAP